MTAQNRLSEILAQLSENQALEELTTLWVKASLIRRWTQEMKKDLSEKYIVECRNELVSAANKKLSETDKEDAKVEVKIEIK